MAEKKPAGLDAFKEDQSVKTIDTSKKVKVGIIGTGWIAEAHAVEYKKMPDVEVVALADLIPGKAEKFKATWGLDGARCYLSGHEMLENEELDAVSICTYNRQHAPCAIDALEHGVNVMLEKPFCVTTEEAVEVIRAEKKSGKILSIGFQPRFNPNMRLIKQIVQSGQLGKIYYIQTGGGRRRGIPTPFGTTFIEDATAGIGAMADIGCYSLDMVLNALGYPKPLTVSGFTTDYFGKNPEYWTVEGKPANYADIFSVDDFAGGLIRLEGGIILDFRIAWAMNLDTSGDTIIMGTKGSLRIPSTECWNGSIGGPLKIYHDVEGTRIGVATEIPMQKALPEGEFYHKLRSFLDAVKEGGSAPVPSSEILYNQAIIDHIVKSSKLGHEVEVEIPEI
ncbi:MAG: Gfo/Idh/MocA family oxidoreductase [Clostridia bacterium]|nr:Gfo/Idh/MocA family oxidoreductase [Clostridia bacterium]MBR3715660.1 Gfo/Idh/MocA family oxidoreductase [Clostridia bacterium]